MRKKLLVLALCSGLAASSLSVARAKLAIPGTVVDAVKVLGIGYAVKVFGPQINAAINSVLAQRGIEREGGTKVVPILSVGQGLYVGAAQVMGAVSRIEQVQAVAQGEVKIGDVRLNGLFPVDTLNPVTTMPKAVEGVGISAIMDFDI